MVQSSDFSEKLASLLNTFMSGADNFDNSLQEKQDESSQQAARMARNGETLTRDAGQAQSDERKAQAFRKKISDSKKKQLGKILRSGMYIDLTNIPFDVALAYRKLGVDAGADLSTVRKIFRQKIKEIHPDKNLQRDDGAHDSGHYAAHYGTNVETHNGAHDSAEELIAAYEKIKNWFA